LSIDNYFQKTGSVLASNREQRYNNFFLENFALFVLFFQL